MTKETKDKIITIVNSLEEPVQSIYKDYKKLPRNDILFINIITKMMSSKVDRAISEGSIIEEDDIKELDYILRTNLNKWIDECN